jgi:uncharacterized protein
MKNRNFYLLFSLLCCVSSLWAQPQPVPDDVLKKLQEMAVVDQKVMMPMRDGVRLSTDIFRPKDNQKVPIIFSKTPYNFNSWGDGEMRSGTYN